MANELFTVYCRLHGISGMDDERTRCEGLIGMLPKGTTCIAVIDPNGSGEWVYGQCSFKREADDDWSFKFCDTWAAVQRQSVLPTLIRDYGVTALMIDDSALAARIGGDPAMRRHAGLIALVASGSPERLFRTPPRKTSFLSRLLGG